MQASTNWQTRMVSTPKLARLQQPGEDERHAVGEQVRHAHRDRDAEVQPAPATAPGAASAGWRRPNSAAPMPSPTRNASRISVNEKIDEPMQHRQRARPQHLQRHRRRARHGEGAQGHAARARRRRRAAGGRTRASDLAAAAAASSALVDREPVGRRLGQVAPREQDGAGQRQVERRRRDVGPAQADGAAGTRTRRRTRPPRRRTGSPRTASRSAARRAAAPRAADEVARQDGQRRAHQRGRDQQQAGRGDEPQHGQQGVAVAERAPAAPRFRAG